MATEQTQVRGGEKTEPSAPISTKSIVVVEQAAYQDIPAICTLYKRVWELAPPGVPNELVKSWQPTPLEFTSWMGGVTYFAARKDGRLVGVVGCELHHRTCRMVHLAVDPDTRRQGVATALVNAVVEWAKKEGVTSIWVDSLHGFAPATALFEHLGFARAGVLHQHEWGEDVNLFERLI